MSGKNEKEKKPRTPARFAAGPAQAVKITGLGDPEEDSWADEMCGLLCQARAEGRWTEVTLAECEAKKGSPNRQLLKDYSYWFWNNG